MRLLARRALVCCVSLLALLPLRAEQSKRTARDRERALHAELKEAGKQGKETLRYAAASLELGKFYSIMGELDSAEPHYQRALNIRRQRDPESVETAEALHFFGAHQFARGRFLAKIPPPEKHPLFTYESHQKLLDAISTDVQRLFSRAEDLLRQSLVIREKKLGTNDQQTMATRSDLASTYLAEGKYEDAVREFEIVLPFLERMHGPEARELTDPLVGVAVALNAYGDSGSAEGYSRRALAIAEKVWSADSVFLLPVLEAHAAVLRKLKRDSQAQALEARAQSIRVTIGKRADVLVVPRTTRTKSP